MSMTDDLEENQMDSGTKEACCYGPLHPMGRVKEAKFFREDPDRPNGLAEFCKDCEAWDRRQKEHGGFPVPPAATIVAVKSSKKGAGQMEAIVRKDGHKPTRACEKCGRQLRAPRKELKPGEELPRHCFKCTKKEDAKKKPGPVPGVGALGPIQKCGHCKHVKPQKEFTDERGKNYKTCNTCRVPAEKKKKAGRKARTILKIEPPAGERPVAPDHPGMAFAIWFEEWKRSPAGISALNLSTLTPGPYLENRIHNAAEAA